MKRLWRPGTTLRDKIIPKTKEQRDCLSTPPGGNWDAASFPSRKRENKTDRPRLLLSKGWCNFVSMQMVLRKHTKTKGRLFSVFCFFFPWKAMANIFVTGGSASAWQLHRSVPSHNSCCSSCNGSSDNVVFPYTWMLCQVMSSKTPP